MRSDILLNGVSQFIHAAKNTSSHSLVGQITKEPLHHVEPRGACGCKMKVEPRIASLPGFDFLMFVGRIVVAYDVDLLVGWSAAVDQAKERQPLLMPVLVHAPAYDFAICRIHRRKQRSGSMALIVMGHSLASSFLQGQSGLRAVQCLDLALFIAAENKGMLWRR